VAVLTIVREVAVLTIVREKAAVSARMPQQITTAVSTR
jgi:hypothetical protein